MTKTVIIGGGIAGLATAALLAKEGHNVTIFERGDRVGGRAGTVEREGFRFDTGPSWYLMPRVFEHFFELMGTRVEDHLDLQHLSPGYRLFPEPEKNGTLIQPITVPAGREAVKAVFETLEPGSAEKLDQYLDSSQRTSLMAENYFLYNPFTSMRSLLKREVLGSLGTLSLLLTRPLRSFIARKFRHPLLRQILGYPAVFLGTDPRKAPAMYHLMSGLDLDDGVLYPMGGFWRLVQQLESIAREAGVNILTSTDVTEIVCQSPEQSGSSHSRKFKASGIRWRDVEGTEHYNSADVVVSAADLHHTETVLLPREAQSYPELWWQTKVSGPGAVLVLLGVRGELPELPHHSLFFTRDWDQNFDSIFGSKPGVPDPASIYVCKPSATDPDVAPSGTENLFVLVPIHADPATGAGGSDGTGDRRVEQVADTVIDQISAWADIPDLRERIIVRETIGPRDFETDYHSWRGGMLGPAHILKQSAMFRPQNESKKVDGLYYAGATTAPGVGVPMCLISAELVLKRIRGDKSAGPIPAKKP